MPSQHIFKSITYKEIERDCMPIDTATMVILVGQRLNIDWVGFWMQV